MTDCAAEFLATHFRDWDSQLGIDQAYSVAHEPVHNGAVERVTQTITRSTRQLLLDGALPARFWPAALAHDAVWVYNCFPHASLDRLFSPYTAMFNQSARLHHLRGFGSLADVKLWPRLAKLTAHQAFLGVFIGFSPRSDACNFWDPARYIIVSSVSFRSIPNTNFRHYHKFVLPPPPASPLDVSSPTSDTSHDLFFSGDAPDFSPPPLPSSPAPFRCAVVDCRACALERIFLTVRAHQEPFDERYETNNQCQVCSLGGSLCYVFHTLRTNLTPSYLPRVVRVARACRVKSMRTV